MRKGRTVMSQGYFAAVMLCYKDIVIVCRDIWSRTITGTIVYPSESAIKINIWNVIHCTPRVITSRGAKPCRLLLNFNPFADLLSALGIAHAHVYKVV